jgi:hypothetical protein
VAAFLPLAANAQGIPPRYNETDAATIGATKDKWSLSDQDIETINRNLRQRAAADRDEIERARRLQSPGAPEYGGQFSDAATDAALGPQARKMAVRIRTDLANLDALKRDYRSAADKPSADKMRERIGRLEGDIKNHYDRFCELRQAGK